MPYSFGTVETLEFSGSDKSGTINVTGVAAGSTTLVFANGGDDRVTVGSTGGDLGTVLGSLSVDGGAGKDVVRLNDSAHGIGEGFTVTSSTVHSSRPGFSTVKWDNFSPGGTWQTYPGDFNGDGKADVASFYPANGQWYVSLSNGSRFNHTIWDNFSPGGVWKSFPGDFNGDGRTDIASFYAASGQWYVSLSQGNRFHHTIWDTFSPGGVWESFPGDFNGDGRTDIASFYPANGQWYVSLSRGNRFHHTIWDNFSPGGVWQSYPGDFNGDGRTDIASFYPANGQWYVSVSNGSRFTSTVWDNFSPGGVWKSYPGDFNGDGRTDVASFYPADGTWWVSQSTGSKFQTYRADRFDAPAGVWQTMPGDYDGDGRDELTSFYAKDGTWWTGLSRFTRSGVPAFGMEYAGVEELVLDAGRGPDQVHVRSTAPGTAITVNGGGGGDELRIGLGSADAIRSRVTFAGGSGTNSVIVDDSLDTTGDALTITATQLGAGVGDKFFGAGGSLSYREVTRMDVILGKGADTVMLTPSATTSFRVNGGVPQSSSGSAKDRLRLTANGATGKKLVTTVAYAGKYTFANRKPIEFESIELLA